jgi:DNA-directed RNA polymerase subunit RPC12/RpoP
MKPFLCSQCGRQVDNSDVASGAAYEKVDDGYAIFCWRCQKVLSQEKKAKAELKGE